MKLPGAAWAICALAFAHPAAAQTDEIQVYDAQIAAPGVINLTLDDNYTPHGLKTPASRGDVVRAHTLNGVPEWAPGVTPWFEAGLYLPLSTLPRTAAQIRPGPSAAAPDFLGR